MKLTYLAVVNPVIVYISVELFLLSTFDRENKNGKAELLQKKRYMAFATNSSEANALLLSSLLYTADPRVYSVLSSENDGWYDQHF